MAYSNKSFQVKWEDMFYLISAPAKEIVRKHTYGLKDDIQKVWPVKTGKSKAGWKVAGHPAGWTVYNTVKNPVTGYAYVPDLWRGKSDQLPFGGDPIVRMRRLMLITDLKHLQLRKGGAIAALRRRGLSSLRL